MAPGIGEQRICSLRQLANENDHGDFVYDDWQMGAEGQYDPTDVFAEVSAYYHVQRMYEMLTSTDVGLFDRLPGRHEVGFMKVPLNVVVNYQAPTPTPAESLTPQLGAFFVPDEHLQMGMSLFAGLEGIRGDTLVFGQAQDVDFAYAGETIYHEFGHAVVHALAEPTNIFADGEGLTNQGRAIHEGLANTFAFLMSGQTALNAYLSSFYDGGFTFHADNEAVFPDDCAGHPVSDGNPLLSANWRVLQHMAAEAGWTREQFVRVLLLTLEHMRLADGHNTFAQYAETFVQTMTDEGFESFVPDVEAIFEARGFGAQVRARPLDVPSTSARLFVPSAVSEPWNTVLKVQEGGEATLLSTAYTQLRFDVPAGVSSVTFDAEVKESASNMSDVPDDWEHRLFVRRGAPVEYEVEGLTVSSMSMDEALEPSVETTPTGTHVRWELAGLSSGETVYVHVVNEGSSEAWLTDISLSP